MGHDPYLLHDTAVGFSRAIHAHGLRGPTLRQVADECNLVQSALVHRYGSRDALLSVVGAEAVSLAVRQLERRVDQYGWRGFLPDPAEPDSIYWARVRLDLAALARRDDTLASAVSEAVGRERRLLQDCLFREGSTLTDDDPRLAMCAATFLGLWEGLCNPTAPLAHAAALAAWSWTLDAARSGASGTDA